MRGEAGEAENAGDRTDGRRAAVAREEAPSREGVCARSSAWRSEGAQARRRCDGQQCRRCGGEEVYCSAVVSSPGGGRPILMRWRGILST